VVEQTKDLISLEKTGSYQGVYHVLMGRLAPLENQHSEDTTVEKLISRVKSSLQSDQAVEEIIIATNPNLEGDTTALYIRDLLKGCKVKISRIARGIPSGGSIEFANQAMLTDAMTGRQTFGGES
jgi:recombination protein RecR